MTEDVIDQEIEQLKDESNRNWVNAWRKEAKK
jgi:hypothetical protein